MGDGPTLEVYGPAVAGSRETVTLLTAHTDAHVRVRPAVVAALWAIGGEAEPPAVLDVLLQAWKLNGATATTSWPAWTAWAPSKGPLFRCSASSSFCPAAAADSTASTATRNSSGSAAHSSPGHDPSAAVSPPATSPWSASDRLMSTY